MFGSYRSGDNLKTFAYIAVILGLGVPGAMGLWKAIKSKMDEDKSDDSSSEDFAALPVPAVQYDRFARSLDARAPTARSSGPRSW